MCVCVWFEYYSAIKKKGILLFVATWMNPEGIMLSAIRHSEKDNHCVVPLICGIEVLKKSNSYRVEK